MNNWKMKLHKKFAEPFCNKHEVRPCEKCGTLEDFIIQEVEGQIIGKNKKAKVMTRVESIHEVKKLFEMVYQWGRVGIVVDYKAPAFQQAIKEIKKSEYFCPCDIYEAPELGEICPICGEEV